MAAKIGILGDSTTTSGTVTLYTVPSSKAARFRNMYAVRGGAGTYGYTIVVNGINVINRYATSGVDIFSGIVGAGSQAANLIGNVEGSGILENLQSGAGVDWMVLPYPADFFINADDTVQYVVTTTTLASTYHAVVGVEDDA